MSMYLLDGLEPGCVYLLDGLQPGGVYLEYSWPGVGELMLHHPPPEPEPLLVQLLVVWRDVAKPRQEHQGHVGDMIKLIISLLISNLIN